MKTLFLLLLSMLTFGAMGQGQKFNQYPNTGTLQSGDLLLLSRGGLGTFNITGAQLDGRYDAAGTAHSATNGFPWGTLYDPAGTAVAIGLQATNFANAIGLANTNYTIAASNGLANTVSNWDAASNAVYQAQFGPLVSTNDTRSLNLTNNANRFGGGGSLLTNVPLQLGQTAIGSNGATAVTVLGFDGSGKVTTNTFPTGGGIGSLFGTNALLGVTNTVSGNSLVYTNGIWQMISNGVVTLSMFASGELDALVVNVTNLNVLGTLAVGTFRLPFGGNQLFYSGATSNATALANGGANTVIHGTTPPAYSAVVEADLGLTDITTANVSTSAHGFVPKLPNDATKYMDGTGAFSVPAGSGGGSGLSSSLVIMGQSANNSIGGGARMMFVGPWVQSGSLLDHGIPVGPNPITLTNMICDISVLGAGTNFGGTIYTNVFGSTAVASSMTFGATGTTGGQLFNTGTQSLVVGTNCYWLPVFTNNSGSSWNADVILTVKMTGF